MRIISIVNNFGQSYDGVGAFAKTLWSKLPLDVELVSYSAVCRGDWSIWKKVLCLGMHSAFKSAYRENHYAGVDFVIVDYPFVEWNPVVLLDYAWTVKWVHRSNGRVVLSLHEFDRLNPIRKAVVKRLASMSDAMLVSSTGMGEELAERCGIWHVRRIPSNIDVPANIVRHDDRLNDFAFFGLVNKAKAFFPMLDGWMSAGVNGRLKVITATDISIDDCDSVTILKNLDDEDVVHELSTSKACIIPIIPEIDEKNTTFVTAVSCGCLVVGHFCEKYRKLPFVFETGGYSPKAIAEQVKAVSRLSAEEVKRLSEIAQEYSKGFSSTQIAEGVFTWLKETFSDEYRH